MGGRLAPSRALGLPSGFPRGSDSRGLHRRRAPILSIPLFPRLSEKLSRSAWSSNPCWKRRRRWAEGRRGSGKGSGVRFPFPTLTSSLVPPVSLVSWEEAADLRSPLCIVYNSGELRKKRRIWRRDTSHPSMVMQGGWALSGCSGALCCPRGSALGRNE